jgi:hypothetical protein
MLFDVKYLTMLLKILLNHGGTMAIRLKTLDDVRRYLANLINRVERGEVDPAISGRLGYLCNILSGAIKDGDLERRIAELEEIAARKEDK